jgi:type VI secretion system protein ImpK
MSTGTLEAPAAGGSADASARGALALALQEAFTAAVRLRAGRQPVADATAFRTHVKHLLRLADQEAGRAGYDAGQVRFALYAYVAFLDESVLNCNQPAFATWTRQPLQEEVFGDHMAGETFFRYLEDLLRQPDSAPLADLLEVFQLCMLLGFRGRYGADPAGMHGITSAVDAKIRRIRGVMGAIAPAAELPAAEVAPPVRDPWVPRLVVLAGVSFLIALALFVVFRLALGSGAAELDALVTRLLS